MPTDTDMQLGEEIHEVAASLAGFRLEVAEKFGAVNTRLEVVRSEMKDDLAGFRAEMAKQFAAVKASQEAFRSELKEDLAEKFGAVNTRLEVVRSEMKDDLAGFRTEMAKQFAAVKASQEAFRSELKEDLAEKFGVADTRHSELKGSLAEKFGAADTRHGEFRSEVDTNLKFIRWIGVFFAGLLVSLVVGVVTVSWNASALYSNVQFQNRYLEELKSEVKEHGARLQKIEGQIDGISKQLELLIHQTAPKAAGAALIRDTETSSRKLTFSQ